MNTFIRQEEYGSGPRQKPCRSCMDFKSWSKQQKEAMNMNPGESVKGVPNASKAKDHGCPLDKDELGNATWAVLHTIAAKYPDQPSNKEMDGMKQFVNLFSQFYPCEHCAEDFQKDLQVHPPRITSHHDFSQWLCEMHNRVNKKLGKPLFDCKFVDERWRDGWRDGSCD